MRPHDVVTTFKRLVDPNSGSQALSAFKGVLSPGKIKAGRQPDRAVHVSTPRRRASRP